MSNIPRYVKTNEEIIAAVDEFNAEGSNQRNIIGSLPIYFVCVVLDRRYQFGLSKFVAFYNITTESYISRHRYQRNGGDTQKRLKRVTGKEWIPYDENSKPIREAFKNWIHAFHSIYDLRKANIILLESDQSRKVNKRKISQDEFDKVIEHKQIIGATGEQIAFQYEFERIKTLGCTHPEKFLRHTSKIDVGAGYDLYSFYNDDVRLIEVKTSMANDNSFYLTANELEVFRLNKLKSYIYLVHITDLINKTGNVVKVINDPYKKVTIEPIVYSATLK